MSKLLNTEEAALHVSLSASHLTTMRRLDKGPAYMKLGRSVRYALADLDNWLGRMSVTPGAAEPA